MSNHTLLDAGDKKILRKISKGYLEQIRLMTLLPMDFMEFEEFRNYATGYLLGMFDMAYTQYHGQAPSVETIKEAIDVMKGQWRLFWEEMSKDSKVLKETSPESLLQAISDQQLSYVPEMYNEEKTFEENLNDALYYLGGKIEGELFTKYYFKNGKRISDEQIDKITTINARDLKDSLINLWKERYDDDDRDLTVNP